MASRDELLGAKLSGTVRRGVNNGATDDVIIDELRKIAAGHNDVLRREAARALGGFLGLPSEATDVRAAYLLIAAAGVTLPDARPLIAEVDAARRRVTDQHGTGAGHGDRPPT